MVTDELYVLREDYDRLVEAGNVLADRLTIICDSLDVGWSSEDAQAIGAWHKVLNQER